MRPSFHTIPQGTLAPFAALLCLLGSLAHADFLSPVGEGGRIAESASSFAPEWCFESPFVFRRSSPTLADINGDGTLEVIVGSLSGDLYVLDPVTGQPMPGWPQRLSGPIDSTPAVGDVDGDGQVEIVCTCGISDAEFSVPAGTASYAADGAIYVFEADGSLLLRHASSDWWTPIVNSTQGDGFTESFVASPTLADLDGDGVLEIVAASFDMFLYAINATGGSHDVSADGQVDRFNTELQGSFANSVLRVDNDNDGRWDEDPAADWTPWPHAGVPLVGDGLPGIGGVDDDGDGLIDEAGIDHNGDGWPDERVAHPFDDDEDSDQVGTAEIDYSHVDEDPREWPHHLHESMWGTAAVCDLNGDGQLEVIQAVDGIDGSTILALQPDATPLPGWEDVTTHKMSWTPMTVGDIDGDGTSEIFMGTNTWWHPDPSVSSWRGGYVQGLSHDGTEIRDGDGDPSTNGIFAVTSPLIPGEPPALQPFIFDAPSLGDLDNDGELEIVVGVTFHQAEGIFAWNPDGSTLPGFPLLVDFDTHFGPQTLGGFLGGTTLADIDGDGDIEIMGLSATAFFVALHHDGTHVEGSPFWGMNLEDGRGDMWFGEFQSTPAVGDIDNDGRVEIVFAGRDHQIVGQGVGRVYCVEAGPHNPLMMPWPMESHDALNTGNYDGLVTSRVPGDVNADGVVDAGDVTLLTNTLHGETAAIPNTSTMRNAHLASDNLLGPDDLDALVQMILSTP